jgi:glycosyltransferase involved in cell wall biosynthesis
MRVLIIDKTAVLPTSRAKWRMLNARSSVEVTLLCPHVWVENYTHLPYEQHPDDDYPVITGRVLFPGYGNRGLYLTGLCKAIHRTRPDIVHCVEEPFSLFTAQTLLAMRLLRRNAKLTCYGWENLAYDYRYPYRPRALYKCIEGMTLKRIGHAVVANTEAGNVLRNHGYRGETPVVYYGTDLSAFHPGDGADLRRQLGLSGKVIGYIGRLLPSKGVDLLVRALAQLGGDVTLLIIGEGEARSALQKLANQLGMTDRIRWVEVVDHAAVPDYLQTMDALALPSRTTPTWKEQYGRVLVEAMACGVPVVGSDSGAIPEVIGDAGLIFPENEHPALAACLRSILDAPEVAASFREKGLARALGKFSNAAFVDGLIDVYRQILEVD